MLTIEIPALDVFDEETSSFATLPSVKLRLEHSLVSISKWEARYEKAFLGPSEKTSEEVLSYIHDMVVDDVDPSVLNRLTADHHRRIQNHLEAKMTATTFHDRPSGGREVITSELIYYWMIAHQIPFECQTWHLNRLLTLVKVCNLKNTPPKKMSRGEALRQRQQLNAQRRAAMQSRG